ncbi:hypothetical protein ILP92_16540 [Maribius pontilimi]|uniref:Hemolysin-type calcium-binding repeat-containing protein n=1 Tax=Palleronia pontilimi TaxID=1964209 RepID=A0A934IK00_9RHOB|nr:calcium-binding protein [Palleronia pontilimi]MBJ3764351.1 hypothetical protein [Palleronia pontilimi]
MVQIAGAKLSLINHGHTITGSSKDDDLQFVGGSITLDGYGGDDRITYFADATNAHDDMTILAGHKGDDILWAEISTRGQVHIFGGDGDDRLILDLTKASGPQSLLASDPVQDASIGRHGHHVFGGSGADTFEFRDLDEAENKVIGRIDDFDASRDTISIDGQVVDLTDPPANVRIVGYQGQQWILIDDKILYALEGARLETEEEEEVHFIHWPEEWKNGVPASADEIWIDQVNFVPFAIYSDRIDTMNHVTCTGLDIRGSAEADYFYSNKSGGSSEVINGYAGDDVIHASTGHDTVFGGKGNDAIAGGLDDDRLFGNDGDDSLWGGSENDLLNGGEGSDSRWGGTGNDLLLGGNGNDVLMGGSGRETIWAGSGSDTLRGGVGNDRIGGGTENDLLLGGNGTDVLLGGSGRDRLWAGSGSDTLRGGGGDDRLGGGGGNDVLHGGTGQDRLWAGSGSETLPGGSGDDRLGGGGGNDLIDGDSGSDTLIGGSGQDVFVFKIFGATDRDVVKDFDDDRDMLVFYGDTPDVQSTDGGALFKMDNGYELFVEDLSISDIDNWNFTVL